MFKDINPHAPVHLLFVPKKHIRSVTILTGADQEILSELIMVAKEWPWNMALPRSGYKLLYNVEKGRGAGRISLTPAPTRLAGVRLDFKRHLLPECCVAIKFKMLTYYVYAPLSNLIAPCLQTRS